MNQGLIEKGDIVALKDGREVEVLSVKMDGNELRRFDFVDRREESPMRRTEYPSAIMRLLRKGNFRKMDPKQEQPNDNPIPSPTKVEVVNSLTPITGKPKTSTGKVK